MKLLSWPCSEMFFKTLLHGKTLSTDVTNKFVRSCSPPTHHSLTNIPFFMINSCIFCFKFLLTKFALVISLCALWWRILYKFDIFKDPSVLWVTLIISHSVAWISSSGSPISLSFSTSLSQYFGYQWLHPCFFSLHWISSQGNLNAWKGYCLLVKFALLLSPDHM